MLPFSWLLLEFVAFANSWMDDEEPCLQIPIVKLGEEGTAIANCHCQHWDKDVHDKVC